MPSSDGRRQASDPDASRRRSAVHRLLARVHLRFGRRGFQLVVTGSSVGLSIVVTTVLQVATDGSSSAVSAVGAWLPGALVTPLIAAWPVSGLLAGMLGEAEEARVRLDRMAHTDPLTGIANRRGLAVAAAEAGDGVVAMADVDGLKAVNDHDGHGAGDAMLIRAARLLVEAAGPDARVARVGGDEFAVVAPGAPEDLRGRLAHLAWGGDGDVRLTVGVSGWSGTGDLDEALRRADADLYEQRRLVRRPDAAPV